LAVVSRELERQLETMKRIAERARIDAETWADEKYESDRRRVAAEEALRVCKNFFAGELAEGEHLKLMEALAAVPEENQEEEA